MTTRNEEADRIKKLTEKIEKHQAEIEKARALLRSEEKKQRLQNDRHLRREKSKWKTELGQKLIRFYPLPVGEIESIVAVATSAS